MDVSLTLVQTFYHVAHLGSYSAAARTLGISYQSAANHVRRMEQAAGGSLVISEKGGKQIALTPRGRELYNLLNPELEPMLKRLSLIISTTRPLLRIGLPQSFFYYLFPKVLQQLRSMHPSTEIQAFERDTMLAELVKDGSLDVCVSERFFGDADVPQHRIGGYHLSLIYPKSWDFLSDIQNIAAWAADKPFVTYEPGQTLRNASLSFLKEIGVEPFVALSTSGGSSVKRSVDAGLGFSIIPAWCMSADEPFSNSIPLTNLPEIDIYFGHSKFLSNNPLVADLHDICRKVFQTILKP